MSAPRWLRANAEHYLLVAAQDRVGQRYDSARPRPPRGVKELFWLRLFAPVYARLPWSLRSRVLRLMPGSHRQRWTSFTDPPKKRPPAV
jgi:hypothetical protein